MLPRKAFFQVLLLSGLLAATVYHSANSQEKAAMQDTHGEELRGRLIFEGKGSCTSCHRIGERGSTLGPNLTAIGTQLTVEQLNNSLLSPDPEVAPKYRRYQVTTRHGEVMTGKLLNQDPYSLQMITSDNRLIAFARSELRSWGFVQTVPMPSYRETLSTQERADLVAYLVSMTGVGLSQ
ncbi:MAG TPA: hypothetical protein VMB49_00530 [Acidobacteriaceae bacterium]|nr:hypothetical protein [Acidobacteriaceae bacterium]